MCSQACNNCTKFTASQHHYKPCAPGGQLHQFPGIKNIVPLIKMQVIVQRRSLQLQLALLHHVLTTSQYPVQKKPATKNLHFSKLA